jgi:mRNA interferase MazF
MDDWHYALVLSPLEYNRKTSLCVCLIGTSKRKGYPYEIDLPLDLIPRDPSRPVTDSLILCDHVRTMDWRERGAAFRAAAPTPLVEKALDYLLTLLDPYLAG